MEATFEKLLKPKEVAEVLGCSEDYARVVMGSQAMNSVDISRSPKKRMLRVTPANLNKFIQQGGICEN